MMSAAIACWDQTRARRRSRMPAFALCATLAMGAGLAFGSRNVTASPQAPVAMDAWASTPIGVPGPSVPLGVKPEPRPIRQSHGTMTAALMTATPSATSDVAARLQATSSLSTPDTGHRIGPGFAKPARLGRLAADLPQQQVGLKSLTQYAALGRHHRHAGRTRHVARAKHRIRHAKHKAKPSVHTSGRIATNGHSMSCLPSDLRRVLNQVAAKFGSISINSTDRSHSHNRRVGGAPRSLHLECRAVDFAYHGSRRGELIRFLRDHDSVGGLGNYGSGGHIHIDDGPHRSW